VLECIEGDITALKVDAVVNAANSSLMGGAGVDGAIHRAGGPAILEHCKRVRQEQYPDGLPTGEAVPTTAGDMSAKRVIHTVGPVYAEHSSDEAARLLGNCYRNSLAVARAEGLDSIAFPAISTGVYGYPLKEAARVAVRAVLEELDGHGTPPQRVVFCAFGAEAARTYDEVLPAVLDEMK
jgi:O-acetyl-ADP-ribose deacetylase (regulator of RNase III)